MADEKKAAAGGASENSKLIAAIGYIIAVLVPLYVLLTEKKNDKFLAFHAWQSLFLTVGWFVIFIVLEVVIVILTIVSGGILGILSCVMLPVMLVVIIEALLGAYKAYLGEMYKLPLIGDFAMKQAVK